MNKRFLCVCLLSVLLYGCGAIEDESENINISASSENVVNFDENIYFDTSDLTYIGKDTQEIAIGYEFENENDNNPVLTYDQYESNDGEIFSFDERGRLCYYRNTNDIFLGNTDSNDKIKLSEEELQELSENIISCCIDDNAECEAVINENTGEISVSSINDNVPAVATINLTDFGDVRSLSISHNTISSAVDYDYFQAKFDMFIEEINNSYEIADYNYTVRYEQIDNKVYAMYNCNFVEMDGCEFCKLVGFTKTISDSANLAE